MSYNVFQCSYSFNIQNSPQGSVATSSLSSLEVSASHVVSKPGRFPQEGYEVGAPHSRTDVVISHTVMPKHPL